MANIESNNAVNPISESERWALETDFERPISQKERDRVDRLVDKEINYMRENIHPNKRFKHRYDDSTIDGMAIGGTVGGALGGGWMLAETVANGKSVKDMTGDNFGRGILGAGITIGAVAGGWLGHRMDGRRKKEKDISKEEYLNLKRPKIQREVELVELHGFNPDWW